MGMVLVLAWMAAVLYASIPCYWFLVQPLANFWRQKRFPFRAILPLWLLIIGGLTALTWPWHTLQLYKTSWAWLPAVALFAAAISVYRRMRAQFGVANFTGDAELRPPDATATSAPRLVTSGMHARVRHPIYLAHLCMLLGFATGSGLAVNYGLLAFALITGMFMIALEERELERRFGDEWREYKRRVNAVLPSFRRAQSFEGARPQCACENHVAPPGNPISPARPEGTLRQ